MTYDEAVQVFPPGCIVETRHTLRAGGKFLRVIRVLQDEDDGQCWIETRRNLHYMSCSLRRLSDEEVALLTLAGGLIE